MVARRHKWFKVIVFGWFPVYADAFVAQLSDSVIGFRAPGPVVYQYAAADAVYSGQADDGRMM